MRANLPDILLVLSFLYMYFKQISDTSEGKYPKTAMLFSAQHRRKSIFCIYTGRRARDILFCKRIPREEQTFLSARFPPAVPVGLAQGVEAREHKACQGQDGANTDHECEGLVQKDMGGEHCHHGNEVDVDRSLQCAEHPNGKVPGHKAHGRGSKPQEGNIGKAYGVCKTGWQGTCVEEPERRQHEEKSVEERASCCLYGGVSELAYLSHKQRIEGPGKGSQYCQDVALWRELEARAIEAYEGNARHGQNKTRKKACP